jgi:hypothetical protein
LNVYKLHITGYEGEFSAELEYIDLKPKYTIKCSVTPSEEYKTLEIKFKELKSGEFPELSRMEEIWAHTRNAPVLMELQIDPATELITTVLYELSINGEKAGKEAIIFDRK